MTASPRAHAVAALAVGIAVAHATPLTAQDSGYTPHRVYDTRAAAFVDLEILAERASVADVVFFGELHGNVAGHRMQHALAEALQRRGGASLSMEMFERDVAALLLDYARGGTTEDELLEHGRPWPRYASDYRPLVELARRHGWPVIAANAPRELANRVASEGLAAVDALPPEQRAHLAATLDCPEDDYRERFLAEMRRHPMGPAVPAAEEAARMQRYYEAQCVKDETMAESIAGAIRNGLPRPVLHVTGAFHSDYGDGVPVRVSRRVPGVIMLGITLVPVDDLVHADPRPHAARADFLLFTLRPDEPPPAPKPAGPAASSSREP